LTVRCIDAMKHVYAEKYWAWNIDLRMKHDAREISTHRMMKYKWDIVMTRSKCPTFLGCVTNKGIKQTINIW